MWSFWFYLTSSHKELFQLIFKMCAKCPVCNAHSCTAHWHTKTKKNYPELLNTINKQTNTYSCHWMRFFKQMLLPMCVMCVGNFGLSEPCAQWKTAYFLLFGFILFVYLFVVRFWVCVYTFWHPADTTKTSQILHILCVHRFVSLVCAFGSFISFAYLYHFIHNASHASVYAFRLSRFSNWIFIFENVLFLLTVLTCYVMTIHIHSHVVLADVYKPYREKENAHFSRQIAQKTARSFWGVKKKRAQNARTIKPIYSYTTYWAIQFFPFESRILTE